MLDLPIGQHRVRCPACGRNDRDKVMGVKVDHEGAVFHCFRCGAAGNEWRERRHDNTARAAFTGRQGTARAAPARSEPLEWSSLAEAYWRRTQALRGTLGQQYLEHRGCALPPRDSHLRYLPPSDSNPPRLCAAITDARTGKPLSLHFTRLAADGRGKAGTGVDKLLLKGHRKQGGVIRLWPDEAVGTGLTIAEGIETALAAAHAYTPVWACVDAGNLAIFPVLEGIEVLVIVADHDDTGIEKARECGRRWHAAGRDARIVVPGERGQDLADVVAA